MSLWYFAVSGERVGPMSQGEANSFAAQNPGAKAWREGMPSWVPVKNIHELKAAGRAHLPAVPEMRAPSVADEIDYEIFGDDMQFVEVELDPGETVVAEAGAMIYKNAEIQMNAILGDGSDSGLFGKLANIGRRVMTGESMFMTTFQHEGNAGKARVAFGAPYPGKIVPVALQSVGGELICQKDSFLCAAKGVAIKLHIQRRILTGLFGGEGFVMQKLEGDGMVFVHAGGAIAEKELAAGEMLHVDTGCVVAYEAGVDMDITTAGGIKSQLFGGEGIFLSKLTGPGKVWLQSLPFSRLAGRMLMGAGTKIGQGDGNRSF